MPLHWEEDNGRGERRDDILHFVVNFFRSISAADVILNVGVTLIWTDMDRT